MIKVTNLTKSFTTIKLFKKQIKEVLNDLSFNISDNDVVGLIGQNGCGKTTLIRLISTLYKPTSGTILVNDFDTVKNDLEVRKQIGVLLGSDTSLYNGLTAYENIKYFARLNGVSEEISDKRIKEYSSFFNMDSYINQVVDNFSRGMIQKCSFIRAIIHDPKILILDEPSTGLDVLGIEQVKAFIKFNKEEKKTIIISSHNLDEVSSLCNKVLALKDGKISYYGNLDDSLKENDYLKLKELMGIKL